MTVVASVASRNYTAGDRTFGPADIPLGVTNISATFTRENWPLTNQDIVFQCGIEASTDGGLTYPYGAYNYDPANPGDTTRGSPGGVMTNRFGNVIATVAIACFPIPEPDNPNRKVRAFTRILSGLRTGVTVEVF